ncbi:MAG TPA: BamA/TamA family outer membrane protein [Bryobacteraceae bacterium]|nr:BamA/TamA family outer membrane protein [Bryobacteraceae bacterium]
MKYGWLIALVMASGLGASDAGSQVNVNSRYRVERVDISDNGINRISRTLREDLDRLVGEKLNPQKLDRLAQRIRRELNARLVQQKLERGTQPEQVIVLFEVTGRRPRQNFDASMTRGVYHAKQGWSGAIGTTTTVGTNRFSLGIVSDGDELLERYAGVRAGYENTKVGTERVRLGFRFASYHQKWNADTQAALAARSDVPGVYRTRQDFAPSATFVLAEPLTLTVGTSFQRFQTQFPAARTESANAVTTTLRLARRLEDSRGDKHDVEAGYSLRAATKILDTDFAYARHQVEAGYTFTRDAHRLGARFEAGRISGTAPLFERFVLGNTRTLRGWHKFAVNPLGGTREAHGSIEYGYHWFQVFYDTGALWDRGEDAEAKHAIGMGIRTKGGFFLAMAFPVKSGRATPLFMAGTEF